jgi:ankyrin repeat protein
MSSDTGEIFCILDALDECSADSSRQLINQLEELYMKQDQQSNRHSKLKFLITSRPYDNLEASFRKFSSTTAYLHFDGGDKSEQIGSEINLVIDSRVQEIAAGFTADDQRRISENLKRRDNRTYLWLYLTFNIIKESPSKYGKRSDVEKILADIPLQVFDAYEKILSRSSNRPAADILLQIVLAAARPLTLDEANVALTLALQGNHFTSCAELDSELWPTNNFQSIVKNFCGLFISVNDSKLSFIHQTAREFLIHHERQGTWKGRLSIPRSHSIISRSCLQYLLLPDIDIPVRDGPAKDKRRPVFAYAAYHWPFHYISQGAVLTDQSRKDARILCNIAGHQASIWAPIYFSETNLQWEGWTDLVLVSYLGLKQTVEDTLLEENIDVNMQGGDYTALQAASTQGHQEIVRILLDSEGIDIDKKDSMGRTAFLLAAMEERKAVVRTLARARADTAAKDNEGCTALHLAVEKNRIGVLDDLLSPHIGLDVTAKDNKGDTALHYAAELGAEGIVEKLLENKASSSVKNNNGYTALDSAAPAGYEGIARRLLDAGLDVNSAADDGTTALYWVAPTSHTAMVELLLDRGADVDVKNIRGTTSLHCAAQDGTEEIMQLLVTKCQDINARDLNEWTPLHGASLMGRHGMVQLLLSYGADANAEDKDGWTPLHAAALRAHETTKAVLLENTSDGEEILHYVAEQRRGEGTRVAMEVRAERKEYYVAAASGIRELIVSGRFEAVCMWLAAGSDVNEIGGIRRWTPLSTAAAWGQNEIVRLLLEKGADIEAVDRRQTRALHYAAENGDEDIVKILLEKHADIKAKDDQGRTALFWARKPDVVRVLINYGADVNEQTYQKWTRLILAAHNGEEEIARCLLNAGARTETKDAYGMTPLLRAVGSGHSSIVRLLLEKGADTNARDESGTTALALAIELENDEIKNLLIDT